MKKEKREYTGRCHCGNIRFSFLSEEIKEGRRCNCSICIRKGALVSAKYIPAEDFRPHQNMELLTDYRWNDRVVNHLFCKTCGIYPYHGNAQYGFRVNLGCVEQIDPLSLEIKIIDGRSMEISNDPGPHPSVQNAERD
jgi:hypothetical protein